MGFDVISIIVFLVLGGFVFLFGRLIVGRPRNQLDRRTLILGPLTHFFAVAIPVFFEAKQELQKDLRRAGYYHRFALREYLAVRNSMVLGWTTLAALTFWVVIPRNPEFKFPILALGVIVAIIFYSAPRLILHAQAAGRLRRIQYALPDALDMITMSMTGGLPLVQALDHVSKELGSTHPDLGCELTIVRRQMQAGSLEQALEQFAERIDIPDVQSLSALIGQTERLGANVAIALHDYSDGVRRAMRQTAEERGNKASVKLLLPIVFCLAPPVYILLLAPALLELRNFVIEQNRSGGVLVQEIDIPQAVVSRRSTRSTEQSSPNAPF